MAFQQDTEITPVLFRRDRHGEITAIFPAEPAEVNGLAVMCFSHIGQHSGASMAWVVSKTRPASEKEYADLKRELEGPPYGYKLKVFQRVTREHRDAFMKAQKAQAEVLA